MNETDQLKKLRDSIEELDIIHQIHILKIFNEHNIDFTENSNGIFINMTLLDNVTLNEIKKFIKYVNLQEKQLESVEDIKAKYQKEFYKDNKEKVFY